VSRFIETIRFVELVTQDDADVARLTSNPVKPTEIEGAFTVDLEAIIDFTESPQFNGQKAATVITLNTGHQRTLRIPYGELKQKHTDYFRSKEGIVYQLNTMKPA